MSGLLEKDFRLMGKRKNYLLTMVVMVFGLSFITDVTFMLSYLPILCAIFTVSTISYDEFDNGMTFLMTLPVTPKSFVVEKYVLGIITGMVSWVVLIVIWLLTAMLERTEINGTEAISMTIMSIFIYAFFMSMLLPVELKFGSEKGRLVLGIVGGVVILFFGLGGKVSANMGPNTAEFGMNLASVPLFAIILAAVVMYVVSMRISIGIMNKKEY